MKNEKKKISINNEFAFANLSRCEANDVEANISKHYGITYLSDIIKAVEKSKTDDFNYKKIMKSIAPANSITVHGINGTSKIKMLFPAKYDLFWITSSGKKHKLIDDASKLSELVKTDADYKMLSYDITLKKLFKSIYSCINDTHDSFLICVNKVDGSTKYIWEVCADAAIIYNKEDKPVIALLIR